MKDQTVDISRAESRALTRPRWKGADSIQLAHQLNERCIELLSELAANEPFADTLPPFIQRNRDLWWDLTAEARRRLAALPFVIVDVRFRDEAWWRALADQPATPVAVTGHSLPAERCEYLLLETLMFAWQVAREDAHVAQMIFAMTRPVARIIAALAMRQIRLLAIEQTSCLRVRWSENTQFWRELLLGVRGVDEIALEESRLDAKLLFCGDLISPPCRDE